MATVPVLLLLLSAQSRQSTFHITGKRIKWDEARTACKENFTDLVTVYTEEENTKLADLTVKDNFNWIGLYRNQSVISDKWSNGDPVTFNNLPAHDGSVHPVCAAMTADGLWERLICTVQKYFMCYKEGVSPAAPEYHLILEKKSWYEAQSFCRRNFTDLVTIRDDKQNKEVKIIGLNSSDPYWIGLLRDAWHWTDGGNSTYRNWDDFMPKQNDENCVQMNGNGKWFNVPCWNEHFALCYHTSIYVSSGKMSWEEALDHCQKNRSGILQVQSKTQQEEVEAELRWRRRVHEPVWVGLRQSVLFGFWLWTDGAAASPYTNWYGGEQPEHQNSHHCGAIDPQKGFKWCDRDCESTFKVLCRV